MIDFYAERRMLGQQMQLRNFWQSRRLAKSSRFLMLRADGIRAVAAATQKQAKEFRVTAPHAILVAAASGGERAGLEPIALAAAGQSLVSNDCAVAAPATDSTPASWPPSRAKRMERF